MELRPVNKYREPEYPTLEESLENPALLKHLPKRWQNNRAVVAALMSLTMIGTAGCSQREIAANDPAGSVPYENTMTNGQTTAAMTTNAATAIRLQRRAGGICKRRKRTAGG